MAKQTSKRKSANEKSSKAGAAVAEADPEDDDLDLDADTDTEGGEEPEADADNDADTEPDADADGATEEEPEEKPAAKSGKGKTAKAPKAAEAEEEIEAEAAAGYEVVEVPVGSLKMNKLRVPSEDAVAAMVRSIKAIKLQNPIVITQDGVVVSGNTRLLAFRKLNRKTIPARVGVNPNTGERLLAKDVETVFAGLGENLSRTDLTLTELAKAADASVKAGHAENYKDFAGKMGVPYATVQRATSVFQRGSKKLIAALESDAIGVTAAEKLIARCKDHGEMDKIITEIMAESDGKVPQKAVVGATRTRRAGRHKSKAGRKPTLVDLSGEVLKPDDTGLGASLKLVDKDSFLIAVEILIDAGKVDSFVRFDLAKRVQQQLAKVNPKDLNAELEACRKQLTD